MNHKSTMVDLINEKNKHQYERPKNIFAGTSCIETTSIEDVQVIRLTVLPNKTSSLEKSYAVTANPNWTTLPNTTLPFSLQWQQSLQARYDIHLKLDDDVSCIGLGERFSGLNLRGKSHTLCATPICPHIESCDSLYASIPFLILACGSEFSGLFLDSPAPQRWDLDSDSINEAKIELFTRRGWQLYVLGPTTLPNLINAYTALTGKTELPPRWSLGHQQSRYSYPDEKTVRNIAREFRARKIPCDTIVLDIDYMNEYRVFTYSKEGFPHFEQMINDLDKEGFKIVTIVDPGVKQDPKYDIYIEGCSQDHFCKDSKGELFVEEVWPGDCVFPDFLQEKTRKWWANKLKFLLDKRVGGIWNDMNEPEFFNKKQVLSSEITELPSEQEQLFLQHTEHGSVGHFEVRNLYGLQMASATKDGLLEARSDERPFVLTRSGYAGIQRYAAVWLGDNSSWFRHLEYSIPMLVNMGLSGVPFVGVDVGGHLDDASPELLIRWYEAGVFYPFFRNHCVKGGRAQEPFAHTKNVEEAIRKLIEFRYRLLPYIQNLFWEHKRTGAPLMRPLMWHYPDDNIAREIDDQFLFGRDILVAPITARGHRQRFVYLPKGRWYPIEGGDALDGGKVHTIEWCLGSIPAFVRDGAIIPMIDVIQSTADYSSANIVFNVFGRQAEGLLFEDDGRSFAYNRGEYNEWQLTYKSGHLNATAIHKGYKSPAHEYFVNHDNKHNKIDW